MQCIGRIVSSPGDWYAELDFENGEATVLERGRVAVEVCTCPLGEWVPETAEHDAALDPDCPQAQRLCKIVFAPEAWALLEHIRERLTGWHGDGLLNIREEIIDEITRTLDCLTVPGRGE